MTQILLLGTFHFRESGMDIYADDVQQQLAHINKKLMQFNPDAISVEVPIQAQNLFNLAYEKFSLADLKNFDETRSEDIGQFSAWGDHCTLSYNKNTLKNEIYQIGCRLGKSIGLDRIHAIDNDTGLDEITEAIPERVKCVFDGHLKKMHEGEGSTIPDILKHVNADQWSFHNQQLYFTENVIGAGGTYAGAHQFGQWYTRNLKIFANLQKLSEQFKHVFVLYGCGHLYILRDLINAYEAMELVDYRDYL